MDYGRYHNEVVNMQRRMRDYLDDQGHAQARQLEDAFQQLEDSVQVQKDEHTVRDRLKRLEYTLDGLDDTVMSHEHVDDLMDWVRESLRNIS